MGRLVPIKMPKSRMGNTFLANPTGADRMVGECQGHPKNPFRQVESIINHVRGEVGIRGEHRC